MTESMLRIAELWGTTGQLRNLWHEQQGPNTPAWFYANERFAEAIHAQKPRPLFLVKP